MALLVAPAWQKTMLEKIQTVEGIDVTLSFNAAAQWLIVQLTKRDRAFRVYNLGAGVKRITTDTETCPCCKRKLGG